MSLVSKFLGKSSEQIFYEKYQKTLAEDPVKALELLREYSKENPNNKAIMGEIGRLRGIIRKNQATQAVAEPRVP